MPPAQCPECGRFLAKAFVLSLATEPTDCPKCGLRLSATHFPEALGQAAVPDAPVEEPAGAAALRDASTPDPGSVRPPDLDPGQVRLGDDGQPDPLAGWDRGDGTVDVRVGRRPPPDGAIVAGAGAAGAIIGALLARRWGIGVVVGFAAGVAAAATSRQVWRLPD